MSKRDLFVPAAVVLVAFFVGNLVETRRSRVFLNRQKIDTIEKTRDANVLLIGNSTLDSHVDLKVFENTARGWQVRL